MRHYAYTLTPEEQVAIVRHGLLHHPDIAAQRRRPARLVPIGRAPNLARRSSDPVGTPFEPPAPRAQRGPAPHHPHDPLRWWAAFWLHAETPVSLLGALTFLACFYVGAWNILDWLVGR